MSKVDDRYRREKKRVQPQPFFIIVCEGKKTESNYFSEFPYSKALGAKNKQNQYYSYGAVHIVEAAGQHVGVVKEAKKRYDSLRKQGLDIKKQDVWCVFDCDRKNNETWQAIEEARKQGFIAIYSIQCFELWYLLHYQELSAAIDKDKYDSKISQHINTKYTHEMEGMYDILHDKQLDAVKRAEHLWHDAKCSDDLLCDPLTNVHLLVKALNEAHESKYKG